MSAIWISSAALLVLITLAVLVDGPARMVCAVAALVGIVVVRMWALARRPIPEQWDWDRFEADFRDYVQRLERAQ
jgi:hypothetical protein